MAISQFFQAASVYDALLKLSTHGDGAVVLAGGTDLMPALRAGELATKDVLIDLGPLTTELGHIYLEPEVLHVGPMATHRMVVESPLVRQYAPLLAQASARVGSPQIRNRGTLGGNLITLAACADTVVTLLALEARMVFTSLGGAREVGVAEYLAAGPARYDRIGELLTDIVIPMPTQTWESHFVKLARRQAAAKSRMSVAVLARVTQGRFQEVRLAVGAVMPWPRRVAAAEELLSGQLVAEADLAQAARVASELAVEVSGMRRSFTYKVPVLQELVVRALRAVTVAAGTSALEDTARTVGGEANGGKAGIGGGTIGADGLGGSV